MEMRNRVSLKWLALNCAYLTIQHYLIYKGTNTNAPQILLLNNTYSGRGRFCHIRVFLRIFNCVFILILGEVD